MYRKMVYQYHGDAGHGKTGNAYPSVGMRTCFTRCCGAGSACMAEEPASETESA